MLNDQILEDKVIVTGIAPELMSAVSEGSGELYVMARNSQEPVKRHSSFKSQREQAAESSEEEFFDAVEKVDTELISEKFIKRQIELLQMAKEFKPSQLTDEYRDPEAAKDGGFPFTDAELIARYRNAFKDVAKQVGRQIFSGKFDLSKCTFPIKCMAPVTLLNLIPKGAQQFPLFMNAAAQCSDPLERLKFVILSSVCYINFTHSFGKPLNPIIGETYQAHLEDGSAIYMEQISHHPPVSYMLIDGPCNSYQWSGYSVF